MRFSHLYIGGSNTSPEKMLVSTQKSQVRSGVTGSEMTLLIKRVTFLMENVNGLTKDGRNPLPS